MKLSDIQTAIKTLLEESTELSGVTVLVDDGSYGTASGMPAIDEALSVHSDDSPGANRGLCLIVYRVEHESMIGFDEIVYADSVLCGVVIEEVATVNRGEFGTGIVAEDAIERVMRAVLKAVPETPGTTRTVFQPADPPWSPVTVVNGRRKAVVDFVTQHEVTLT